MLTKKERYLRRVSRSKLPATPKKKGVAKPHFLDREREAQRLAVAGYAYGGSK